PSREQPQKPDPPFEPAEQYSDRTRVPPLRGLHSTALPPSAGGHPGVRHGHVHEDHSVLPGVTPLRSARPAHPTAPQSPNGGAGLRSSPLVRGHKHRSGSL